MLELKPVTLNPPLNTTLIRDEAGLEKLKDFFSRCDGVVGFDIETNPLKDYFYRRIRTIQFGNTTEQYVIDLLAFCGGDSEVLYNAQGYYGAKLPDSLRPVINTISPVLCTNNWLKVGVNLGFEYQNFYWLLGLRAWHFFDCAMVERCIWAGALGSMKKYAWFSMESMMARYFEVQIDKTLQESFDLKGELTWEQVEYAALDTRFPMAIRTVQRLVLKGETPKTLRAKGLTGAAKYLDNLSPVILGDNLEEIAQIENDAVGAFEDMHIHGENLDRPRWLARVAAKKAELKKVLAEKLDPVFIPLVGSKYVLITEEQVATAEAKWKSYNAVTDEELKVAAAQRTLTAEEITLREMKKKEKVPEAKAAIDAQLKAAAAARKASFEPELERLKAARVEEKEKYKKVCSDLKKRRTVLKNLAADCEGEALLNYDSPKQLLNVLKNVKGLGRLTDTDDETLEKYEHIPVMAALREFRTLAKIIGTYGDQWATQWTTKPCKDEGWLHPGDGKLHCIYNQYDAETGRSSSEKPNGQNIEKAKEVRSCFIVDPPNEDIRISKCCCQETVIEIEKGATEYVCSGCGKRLTIEETDPEEYVMVTADMSGAELRILADLADDPVWCGAFNRGEDVHSVCTELIEADKWPLLALRLPGKEKWTLQDCETEVATVITDERGKEKKLPPCAYYAYRDNGQLAKQKCKCPEHNSMRDGMKPTNFGLPYGITAQALCKQIHKSLDETAELMAKHKSRFPRIWAYIDLSGRNAKMYKKAFDMFGRRRLFVEPNWDDARERCKKDFENKLRLDDDEQDRNIANFIQEYGRKPTGKRAEVNSETYILTHRLPSQKEISHKQHALWGSMERQGKNHEIQATNATIAKLAMGAGYDADGKPYLWHTLRECKAKLIKFVHDELVVQCPKRFGERVAALIGDAFKRAAATKMKRVTMEFDFNIATYWKK